MNKQDYLDALQKALTGLPPETAAKTMAYYEQRFVDGANAGQADEVIAAELDEPRKIAMTLRANSHMGAFVQKKTPVNAARVLVSAIGLAIFNLFMVVPGLVYASLVAALYACSFAFYASGIVIASAGLAGVTEKVINNPLVYILDGDEREELLSKPARVSISSSGINIEEVGASKGDLDEDDDKQPKKLGLIKRAEEAATRQVTISTDLDTESRTVMSFAGLALMVAGILLTMLSVLVTKFSLHGLRRYLEMNFSLLRGH